MTARRNPVAVVFICPAYVLLTTVKWQFFNNLCCVSECVCVCAAMPALQQLTPGRPNVCPLCPSATPAFAASFKGFAFYFVGPSAVKFS